MVTELEEEGGVRRFAIPAHTTTCQGHAQFKNHLSEIPKCVGTITYEAYCFLAAKLDWACIVHHTVFIVHKRPDLVHGFTQSDTLLDVKKIQSRTGNPNKTVTDITLVSQCPTQGSKVNQVVSTYESLHLRKYNL